VTTRRAFGESLRRHREQRSITLEQISQRTKISVALLKALERGDCSRWPAGIYSRAYIRDFAQAIGLDREETAAQFAECFTETAFPDGTAEPKHELKEAPPAPERPRAPLRMTIVDEPGEHRRELARRTAAVVLDLVLAVAIAALLSTLMDAGFWMALAIVSLCCHGVGVVRGRAHAVDLFAQLTARRQPDPAPAESALAEAT
jgi:transcriptional regulator with XRE-family HTH domain